MDRLGNTPFTGDPKAFKYPCYVAPGNEGSLTVADRMPRRVIGGVNRVFCGCNPPDHGRWVKAFQVVDCRNWPAAFWVLNNMAPRKWACDTCWQTWQLHALITPDAAGAPQGAFDESTVMEWGGSPEIFVQAERDYQDTRTLRARGEVHDAQGNVTTLASKLRYSNKRAQPWRDANGEIIRPENAVVLMEDPQTGRMVAKPNQRPPKYDNIGQRETHAERKIRIDNGG